MTPGTPMPGPAPGPTPVLVAAAGAEWEAEALEHLAAGAADVVLARRCVDLAELLAMAGTGVASVALVSVSLPGLDGDSVSVLRGADVGVVVVAAPHELLDGDAERMRRLGVDHLLVSTELGSLLQTVADAGALPSPGSPPAGPRPEPWPEEPEAAPPGRVLAVWGPAGAPGRTTVAVGLAAELADQGRDVLLVDADPYGGSVGQHLGVLDEASGLLGAARAANAGQADRLAGFVRQVNPCLRVLTGLPRPDRWAEVRPAAFADVVEEAARLAPLVVLDVGFSLEGDPVDPFGSSAPQRNQMTLAALERADEVLVVGAADPVGLARLARGLVELREVVPGLRPRVVVNRTRPSLGWSDREVQGMVEGFVRPLGVHFLPDDRAAADRALMAGRSLAECGESSLRTAIEALVRAVLGQPVAPRARRLRRRRAGGAR
jgi:MinD-like ATPase involved in chromosome partitioning or flagellar assembly